MRKVYGIPISPFVRKVLLALDIKGMEYDLDPVTPRNLPDDYHQLSPMGKIPAYVDEQLEVSDSSVICQYLEEIHPEASIYPSDPSQRARARWYEEYADTQLIQVLGPPLFFERVVKPKFLQEETDEARVTNAIENEIPPVLDYLEGQVPDSGFMFGEDLGIADIAIISPIVNASIARYEIDAQRWPKLAAYVGRILATDVVSGRLAAERALMQAA